MPDNLNDTSRPDAAELPAPGVAVAPADAASAASTVTEALELVRALLAAGALTAESLGLPAAPAAPTAQGFDRMVPGERITVRDLVAKTRRGLKKRTDDTYGTYLRLLADGWPLTVPAEQREFAGLGDRFADEVLPSDLEEALRFVQRGALERAAERGGLREERGRQVLLSDGSGACYNAVGAWRCLFAVAVKDRHLSAEFDPAQQVKKPRRGESRRRALEPQHLEQLFEFVDSTGNDPELDRILVQAIIIAGARRDGLVNLTLGGIDREECTLRLHEKFGKVTLQPVPDWFVERVWEFAVSRGASKPGDKVFRTRPRGKRGSAPITSRRFDYLFQRIQAAYAWADKQQVSAHTLRHHGVTAVERASSRAVSMKFARHAPSDVNDRYSKASEREVAEVVCRLYGGSHPWLKALNGTDGAA